MRINSSFLVVLALSLKSTDGASLKLISNRASFQKQLNQALKMIEVHQSTVPAAHKSVIRGLNQEDSGCNPIDPCIQALVKAYGDDGDGGSPSSSGKVVNDTLSFLDEIGSDAEICDINTGICDFADSPELVNATAACDASSERKLVLNDVLICREDSDPEEKNATDMDITIRNAPVCVPRVCLDNVKLTKLLPDLLQQCPDAAEVLEGIPKFKEQCDSGISIEADNGSDNNDNGGDNSSVATRSIIWSISLTATISIGVYFTI